MLFEPYSVATLALANRIVMSPMTRSRAVDNNTPNALMASYYAQRASAGLIITEGTSPSANGIGYARIPGLFNQDHVKGWKLVTDAVHRRGLNFGWKNFEARACVDAPCSAAAHVGPVYANSHDYRAGGGCSVSGGVVVNGVFFFGDYCTGQIWSLRREGATTKVARLLASARRVTSFGLDQRGQLGLVDHAGAIVPLTISTP